MKDILVNTMGNVMCGNASISIGNLYHKTIFVKYNVQQKYVTLEEFAIKGGLTVAGFGAEGSGKQKKQYDWDKINIEFTPIRPNKFLKRQVTDIHVYLTIITEDGDVVVNTWYVNKDANFVVTEDMDLAEADYKYPLKIHKDYVKTFRANKNPTSTDRVNNTSGSTADQQHARHIG